MSIGQETHFPGFSGKAKKETEVGCFNTSSETLLEVGEIHLLITMIDTLVFLLSLIARN